MKGLIAVVMEDVDQGCSGDEGAHGWSDLRGSEKQQMVSGESSDGGEGGGGGLDGTEKKGSVRRRRKN